ncbi:hypothetical protein LTR78_006579 [Recurvomyces mirabilis]|uniref:Uncharacterized protein n=1 Tax=Recurvomyces mirabilis TaxID=574656 RepID=A0AAE1C068_9PEZI|nr:hypothetical protein LTR78_006579 [Recurvomyces mirabilis]KAK5154675.1 hypothetical protein LTS14_006254 [Recurvomyces mirabilis]
MAELATKGQQAATTATAGVSDKVQSATTGILGRIEGLGNWIVMKGQAILDRLISPEQRANLLAKLQAFMLKNPKLSAFLGMNFALTGIPLFLFLLFTLVVAVFALLVGLILGLLGAVVFILFAVGVALCFVLPAIFFTTGAACFLFLWGLGGYYILKWANGDGDKSGKDGAPGTAIGDRLNSFTGGRLTGFMDMARGNNERNAEDGKKAKEEEEPGKKEPVPQLNGSAVQKQVGEQVGGVTKATGVERVQDKVGSVKGTATGGLGGMTGLA